MKIAVHKILGCITQHRRATFGSFLYCHYLLSTNFIISYHWKLLILSIVYTYHNIILKCILNRQNRPLFLTSWQNSLILYSNKFNKIRFVIHVNPILHSYQADYRWCPFLQLIYYCYKASYKCISFQLCLFSITPQHIHVVLIYAYVHFQILS